VNIICKIWLVGRLYSRLVLCSTIIAIFGASAARTQPLLNRSPSSGYSQRDKLDERIELPRHGHIPPASPEQLPSGNLYDEARREVCKTFNFNNECFFSFLEPKDKTITVDEMTRVFRETLDEQLSKQSQVKKPQLVAPPWTAWRSLRVAPMLRAPSDGDTSVKSELPSSPHQP
jgi:hypothetical protein